MITQTDDSRTTTGVVANVAPGPAGALNRHPARKPTSQRIDVHTAFWTNPWRLLRLLLRTDWPNRLQSPPCPRFC
eukprot:11166640-Lingulodinium_polyedra.AAC.1